MENMMLTQQWLLEHFNYSESIGKFERISTGGEGTVNSNGYSVFNISGKIYYTHRLIWIYLYDIHPIYIDHINGNRLDNRLINLRDVSASENNINRTKINKNNKSGYIGVCWDNKNKSWESYIHINYKKIGLGRFFELSDAVSARLKGELLYHGND